ncbi:hypothetical protein ES702_00419 [subsurface metagenome]
MGRLDAFLKRVLAALFSCSRFDVGIEQWKYAVSRVQIICDMALAVFLLAI